MRIILADDSQYIRTAYRRVLETQSHFEVVGVAEDGEEAERTAQQQAIEQLLDPVTGSPAKGRATIGVICLHVDDLLFFGTSEFQERYSQ